VPDPGSAPRTLLLYLGNPIAGDDAVGLRIGAELASELSGHPRLTAREFSGSPLDLVTGVEGCDRLVLIDAVATGAPVGTVRLFDEEELAAHRADAYPHSLNLPEAWALGRRLGTPLPSRLHLIGIEVQPVQRFREGLSPELEALLPRIIAEARRLLLELLKE
jgi:hydrogenase maturation protease